MIEAHKKSEASVAPYITRIFSNPKPENQIWILGKPFGMVTLAKELYLSKEVIERGFIKPGDGPFDYVEESLGNALGVAIGAAIAQPDKHVICFISDAQLQQGQILESIAFIGKHPEKFKNLTLDIDYNLKGSRGELPEFNWSVFKGWHGFFANPEIDWHADDGFISESGGDSPEVWIWESYKILAKQGETNANI